MMDLKYVKVADAMRNVITTDCHPASESKTSTSLDLKHRIDTERLV